MKEQWRQQMRQKMAGYEQTPPDVDWTAVGRAVTSARRRRRARIVVLWTWRAAAAAAVVLLAGVAYEGTQRGTREAPADRPLVASAVRSQSAVPPSVPPVAPAVKVARPAARRVASKGHATAIPVTEETAATKEAPAAPEPRQADTTVLSSPVRPTVNTAALQPRRTFQPKHKKTDRLTAKVYWMNAVDDSRTSGFQLAQMPVDRVDVLSNNGNGDAPVTIEDFMGWDCNADGGTDHQDDDTDDGGSRATRAETAQQAYETVRLDEQVHHRQPLRFGLSLRYRIGRRWSVESGLMLTRLSSDQSVSLTPTATPTQLTTLLQLTAQELTYIGLPLRASCQLWNSRRFSVYVTAGGAVEKMVRGRQDITMLSDGRLLSRQERSVGIGPLQLSVDGAVGAEYQLARQFSLFAEPGLGYYFDNGSTVKTIYQDHPLNFSLNIGLRLSLR